MEDQTFILEITLAQAGAVTKSIGKTLAAEQNKIERHGKSHPIGRNAVKEWQLLDGVDAQLREQMSAEIGS